MKEKLKRVDEIKEELIRLSRRIHENPRLPSRRDRRSPGRSNF